MPIVPKPDDENPQARFSREFREGLEDHIYTPEDRAILADCYRLIQRIAARRRAERAAAEAREQIEAERTATEFGQKPAVDDEAPR